MLFESALNQRPIKKAVKAEKPVAPVAASTIKKETIVSAPASTEAESKTASKKD